MKQWVQHISGHGEKYEVDFDYTIAWCSGDFIFPKSEYILCDPPEIWEDVTEHVTYHPPFFTGLFHKGEPLGHLDYRLRKVPLWTDSDQHQEAFIVEKKKP